MLQRGKDKPGVSSELEKCRKEFDKTIMTASQIGLSYSDLLDLDIRRFNMCVDGYIKRREVVLNDYATLGHILAGKIAGAVWGNKSFKKPIPEFKLLIEDSEEAMQRKTMQFLKSKGVI